MKRLIGSLVLLLFLPICAFAVPENVVQPAPGVAIELGGGALFGRWEEGLADIENAARRVLSEWYNCPQDMTLYMIEIGNPLLANGVTNRWQDERMRAHIYINFRFHDARMGGEMSAQVGFDFETGKLGSCRIGRWYEGEEGHEELLRELPDTPVTVDKETKKALLDDYLHNVLGLSGYEMLDYGQARFPDGSVLSATIGAESGQVIAVQVNRFGEEDTVE